MFPTTRSAADGVSFPLPIALKRAVACGAPVAATLVLTAAIFLLPAAGWHRVAHASDTGFSVVPTAPDRH